jgi:predicted RNA-binding protein
MCQAKVLLIKDGQEEEIMKDVIELEVRPEGIWLKSFFEDPRLVEGEIVGIDFLKHRVLVKPKERS